jgi:CO dehydrogenase/acetyl-CoA synthase delta subunit
LLRGLGETFGLDPEEETPGRQVVRHPGVIAGQGDRDFYGKREPEAAEIVACERVVFAETKDHLNWVLLAQCAEKAEGEVVSLINHIAATAIPY